MNTSTDALLPSFSEALRLYDQQLETAWKQAAYKSLDLREHPVTYTQKLHTQIAKIMHISQKRNLMANGLTGYHHPTMLEPSETRIQNSRRVLLQVIDEGRIHPAKGYTSDTNPHIDEQGILIDGNERQTFCAPLRFGSYFDSAGNFGPYWVILDPKTLGSDRFDGIDEEYHSLYLVPDTLDREYITQLAQKRGIPSKKLAKVITYAEFIKQFQGDLDPQWLTRINQESETHRREKNTEDEILAQAKLLPMEDGLALLVAKSKDPNLDEHLRARLVGDMNLVTGWFNLGSVNKEQMQVFLQKKKATLFPMLLDTSLPLEVRKACIYSFRWHRGSFSESDLIVLAKVIEDKATPLSLRAAVMDIFSSHASSDISSNILSTIALDKSESPVARHMAFFEMHGNSERVQQTCFEYFQSKDPQEQKLAIYKLARLPLFTLTVRQLQDIERFAKQNKRKDVEYYVNWFLEKFSYITHPEKYTAFTPRSWYQWELQVKRLVADFKYGGDDRNDMKNGVLAYLYRAYKMGSVRLETFSSIHPEDGDYVLGTMETNAVGMFRGTQSQFEIDFGGFGIFSTHDTTIDQFDDLLKKIILPQNRA